jgi:hypothetical protein
MEEQSMAMQVTRTGLPEDWNPASGRTVTVTVTMPVRNTVRFLETRAGGIAEAARTAIAQHMGRDIDQDRMTVEVSYDYPQWKRVYDPNTAS